MLSFMAGNKENDYQAIDAVVNIWTEEALSHRPDWGDEFFVDKMNAQSALMAGLTLEQMIEKMDEAGIERAFNRCTFRPCWTAWLLSHAL